MDFICSTLGLGTVAVSTPENSVTWRVRNREELEIILAIFSIYNLNSTKHLDFLAFTQAFVLYNLSKDGEDRLNSTHQISNIAGSMNSRRTDFVMPLTHKVKITSS